MNNTTCLEDTQQTVQCNNNNCGNTGRSSGLLIAVVLYILLAIILSSIRAC